MVKKALGNSQTKQNRRGVDMNYIQANSPYNDGWTREFYENVEKGIGKQLELFPDLYPPKHIYESPDGGETIYKRELEPPMNWIEGMSRERKGEIEVKHFADGFHEGNWEEDVVQEWPGLDAINKEWECKN